MCGICGMALNDSRGTIDRDALASMNATLVHRGPDSEGMLIDGPVGLAVRRLSIIDLEGGDQPIFNEDGSIAVVQNGEIYNYRELREALLRRGHEVRTRSDTEVLVHLYEEYGLSFLTHLRGMFALALWDARTRRLVIARDRFGIKPLYYRMAADGFSFASELKCLMRQPGFSREIDLDAFEAYLALSWIPTPLTIFREARKLPAGHYLTWELGTIRTERFARPQPTLATDVRSAGADELAEELRERLRDSVRAHLVSDVPVGVLLSGGIDSSVITALAAEESSSRIRTFSIGFEERSFDELAKARVVAAKYDTDHHEFVVRPDAVNLLPAIVETFDEPFADSSALPTYLVSQLAANDVKVVLAGEGGDELFGGYFTYVADQLAPWVGPLATALRPAIDRLPSSSRSSRIDDKAKRFARGARRPPAERHYSWQEVFSEDARDALLAGRSRGTLDPVDLYRERYRETEGAQALSRFQDLDFGISLVDDLLVKTDRSSMVHSLETRVPFLDTVVSDFALSLPTKHKVRWFAKKRLLRHAASPLIPREILDARKQGFSIPAAAWLRGELKPIARELLAPDVLRGQGFFHPEVIDGMFQAHVSRQRDLSRQLWTVLVFTLWYDRIGSRSQRSTLSV